MIVAVLEVELIEPAFYRDEARVPLPSLGYVILDEPNNEGCCDGVDGLLETIAELNHFRAALRSAAVFSASDDPVASALADTSF